MTTVTNRAVAGAAPVIHGGDPVDGTEMSTGLGVKVPAVRGSAG